MNLGSTRQAIHDALAWGKMQQGLTGMGEYLVYLTRIEKSMHRGDPCVDFLEAAYICAAINTLAPHLGGWLKFAYGPDDLANVQSSLSSKLRFDLFPISTPRKHERYVSLTKVSLEGYRLRVWQGRDLPVELYAERVGVGSNNWQRDFADKHAKCLRTIQDWDAEGVGQVSRMVRSLKGDSDEGPTEIIFDLAS